MTPACHLCDHAKSTLAVPSQSDPMTVHVRSIGDEPGRALKGLTSVARGGTWGSGNDMGGIWTWVAAWGGHDSPLLGGAGDIAYPHYLANGRAPAAPVTLTAKPGQRARLRLINAGSDTRLPGRAGGPPAHHHPQRRVPRDARDHRSPADRDGRAV